MAQLISVRLNKGDAGSLGFRLQGGKDFGTPLMIQKVNLGSPAEKAGLQAGDSVIKINTTDVYNLRHKDAQDVIIRSGPSFELTIQRGGSTWKPSVTPLPKPAVSNSYSPVTKTSLAAKPQASIGSIGTGHNLSAKPFSPQLNGAVNGGPKLVNKQYNTPLGLYSEESIAETLSAQTEVLSTGVLGVNFKKNEKNYDATNSEVFRMVQEADKEPRDPEPEPDSGVVTAPLGGIGGLRHVQAPETKPAAPAPQLPPGQNICVECERLIVGVFVRIKDKNLHVECFKCATCGSSLKNVGYYNINNKLYCDVHAKLAAKSNPPAPNLVPVTVPPGGKVPAGTISAALASHSLPSAAAPLSPLPSSNITAQPFQHNSQSDYMSDESNCHAFAEICDQTETDSGTSDDVQNSNSKVYVTEKIVPIGERDNLKCRGPLPFSTYMKVRGSTSFSSPRPFSSVSAPLSPSVNSYATLPKSSPAPASFSSPVSAPSSGRFPTVKPPGSLYKEKGRSLQNVIWPPPPDSEESDLPTASPLYFPPSTHIRVPTPILKTKEDTNYSSSRRRVADKKESVKFDSRESIATEELLKIEQNMEAKMSLCSAEVTNITEKQVAVERIETAAETQMFVESMLQRRPKSPPPLASDLQPKVEVQTEPLPSESASGGTTSNVRASSDVPRVVTRVCVCTNSCCNAKTGELCESCPMRELKRPKDYHRPKLRPVENAVPKRYGSPIITGVSVTINNPSKIREAVKDLFTEIPTKKATTPLGSALATAPKDPFTPAGSVNPTKSVSLPEETKPYLPPERPIVQEPKPQPQPKPKPEKPDTPFISALRIAPERPFTPVDMPAPVKKKKPKEDPILKDLPKPVQWMSMVSALTTAPDRPYSPFISETSSSIKQSVETEVRVEEINKMKETQQQMMKRSVHNETILPKPFVAPKRLEKFEAVNDDKITPQLHFPPISTELKSQYEYGADYSEVKSEISSQIIEQAHLDEKTLSKKECQKKECRSGVQEVECVKKTVSECRKVCSKTGEQTKEEKVVEKQIEETVMKKPLELSGYLQKAEYLPQYQLSLNYDETIPLPHHKDIKTLIPGDQGKVEHKQGVSSTQELLKQTSSQLSAFSTAKQTAAVTKPIKVADGGGDSLNIPQIVFKPVVEDRPPRTSFSPRPGSITPSMINKPAPVLPYYQEYLVSSQLPPPQVNILDPTSPAISRSPSPCPERAPSPFGRLAPRPVSPAAGPPPNPLRRGEPIPKFTKEDRQIREAKKNISEYIPQYREKVDGIEFVRDIEERKAQAVVPRETQNAPITAPSISKYVQNSNVQRCSFQSDKQVSDQKASSESKTVASSKEQISSTKCEMKSVSEKQTITQESEKSMSATQQTFCGTSDYPFRKVNNPEITEQGVLGMHLTNPQRITSPFITQQKTQPITEPTKVPQPAAPPRKASQPTEVPPRKSSQPAVPARRESQPKGQSTTTVSNIVKPNEKSSDPGVSASTSTVSQPKTGSGGGRQAGAIGVSPKRGRGVLNVGGLIGSRVPMCGHCHGHIRGPFITALGKIWCPEHFICNTPSCRRPLHDLGFVEEQGHLYCEYCFEQYIAPPCNKCGAKVKGDCLKAIGKNFHPECFSCSYCGKLFGNSPFFLEDGQPYCETDWNELFTTKCFACGFPVEAGDRWVEALNNNYHSQCFNCTMCKKNLEGQSFFAKGGRPFCKNHAR